MEQISFGRFVSSPTSKHHHHHINFSYCSFSTETCSGSYGFPDLAMAKHCFNSLFATAMSANFLLFPLFTILSYTSRHALLCLHALKAHRNNQVAEFLVADLTDPATTAHTASRLPDRRCNANIAA